MVDVEDTGIPYVTLPYNIDGFTVNPSIIYE